MRVLFVALLLVLITPLICSAQAPNQLVTLSSNGKYLVNSVTNQPVFLTGEDGFTLSVQLSSADVTTYLADRSSRGYNAVWMTAIDQFDQVGAPRDFSGNAPFDGAWFTNPDATYWAQQDSVIQQASASGITIFLSVSFVGLNTSSGYDLAAILASSDATMTAYGAFLGNRYKGYNNIVYVLGGDADPSFSGLYSKLADIANGIKSADPNHLITLEACRVCSPANQSTINAYGGNPPSFMNLNWVYNTEATVVAGCQAGFASASSSIPPLMGEDWYELEHSITGFLARQEGYWEILSGCYLGRLFGNGAIWPFNSPNDGVTSPTWQSQLSSVGSVGQQFLGQLMRSREHWLMAPDTNHSVLTAGFGSGSTLSVAARSSDGQTIIAYFSDGNATAKTINMAEIVSASSTTNAWWYNPQTGTATLIGSFPNSGSQSFTAPDGNDWVLVIDDASANLGAPGGGTANNPAPAITSLSPSTIAAGGQAFTLTVNGSGFISSSTVNFNGTAKATTFVSTTKLTAAILASDIATSGNANVTVTNPAPGGGTTPNFVFVISSSANPIPTLASISPTSGTIGQSVSLTLTGTNFISGSVVNLGGNANSGAVVSNGGNTLTITIPGSQLATAGSLGVTVTNPAPGGGTSAPQTFTVNNAAPSVSSLSPTSAPANSGGFTLTVNGSNFVSGATVNFNGAARSTTFVSSTKVTAGILATDIAATGNFPVTVTNPAPGGGTSTAVNFAVTNPPPTVSTISPTSATAGGGSFTLTVNGSGFVSGATVNFGGNGAITPTSTTSTQIVATIPMADIATAGSVNVTVTNPAPGGGTSGAQVFTINNPNNPTPTLGSISPTSAVANGAAFSLTMNGNGFVSGAKVNFGSNPALTPSSITGSQIIVTIPASDTVTPGSVSVTVTNPAPGGGTSGGQPFAINNPAPTVASISPASVTAGGAAFTLTVNGTNFVSTSVVNFNGVAKTTTFKSASQVSAAIAAADIATAGAITVTVTNPAPGGGTSSITRFTVNNSIVGITSLSPASAVANSGAFALTVNGSNFVSGSTVNFNGAARSTTFVSSTKVTAAILATDIAATGNFPVTVTNPAPGGGTSTAVNFAVTNPPPTVSTISPTSATAGGGSFTLTVNGTGFVSGATVKFGGSGAITPTSTTSAQIVVTIPAADIATAGTESVTVTNPAPGGGTSGAQTFTINNSAPTLSSISPTSATAGGAAFTLTVNGAGFVASSVVKYNGVAKTTTVKSASQLTAAITAADIATAGTAAVTVTNPAPGGGTSSSTQFTIDNSAVAISSVSPTSALAGGAAFTLTVNGSGFVSASTVKFNGVAKTTTFKSATQLSAAITAADIASAEVTNVTVTNPAPGGGTSIAASFTINNAPPTLSSLSPSSANEGGVAFTLAVNGSGFVNGATVQFKGANRTTTFVSSTKVTAAILATDIASAGTATVTVTNPSPTTGPSSPAQNFVVNSAGNLVPDVTALGPAHFPGGTAFTLTLAGTNFVLGSVVNFNGKAEATKFISATSLSATIPASDLATAGSVSVTVTNPSPGGTSAAMTFIVDGYSVSGPSAATVTPAQPATIQIAVTPSANGFANLVSFSVTGLPANVTVSFNPKTVTPNGKSTSTTLMLTSAASAAAKPSSSTGMPSWKLSPVTLGLWLMILLGGAYAGVEIRKTPRLRIQSAIVTISLVVLMGLLQGCATTSSSATSPGTSQLTISATSGTLTRTIEVTLTSTQ
jgi:hypothetical protein